MARHGVTSSEELDLPREIRRPERGVGIVLSISQCTSVVHFHRLANLRSVYYRVGVALVHVRGLHQEHSRCVPRVQKQSSTSRGGGIKPREALMAG